MGRNFRLFTDSCSDLPLEMVQDLGVSSVALSVIFNGGEEIGKNDTLDPTMVYSRLRNRESISTSAVSAAEFTEVFETVLQGGEDLLYIGFSSALSATYVAAKNAAEELSQKYPERKIMVVDSKCASLGQGLLVYLVAKYSENGASIEETAAYAEKMKLRVCHEFTVDDLFFLKRGGRVSAATAVLGSMLSIKPILHVDDEGRLINIGKIRGRQQSLAVLCDKLCANAIDPENQMVFISHGDCKEDAEKLAEMIRQKAGVKNIMISYVGPVIGSHSGPGTMALFFVADHR